MKKSSGSTNGKNEGTRVVNITKDVFISEIRMMSYYCDDEVQAKRNGLFVAVRSISAVDQVFLL